MIAGPARAPEGGAAAKSATTIPDGQNDPQPPRHFASISDRI
ncbi:hypothetical protein [Methylobacterium terricola]|nr:hypothetical protein [Methylobacterium terricola]